MLGISFYSKGKRFTCSNQGFPVMSACKMNRGKLEVFPIFLKEPAIKFRTVLPKALQLEENWKKK